jgi:hypothetical protein
MVNDNSHTLLTMTSLLHMSKNSDQSNKGVSQNIWPPSLSHYLNDDVILWSRDPIYKILEMCNFNMHFTDLKSA